MKKLFLFATALVFFVTTSGPAKAQTTMTWTVDGTQRQAIVFAPAPTFFPIRHPLIFAFHGHGGNMSGTAIQMHLETLWPEAIVVYPQGLNAPGPIDPVGTRTGWQYEANETAGDVGNRDLHFFDAMLATMKQTYRVDEWRIYSTGFSSGGVFSYLLWAERGQTIAAIGEVAGRLWDTEQITEPRAALLIAGSQDTTDPFPEQVDSMNDARQADHTFDFSLSCGQYCSFYPSWTRTPVKTFIHPDGHVYPPWAPEEIVKFFKTHRL